MALIPTSEHNEELASDIRTSLFLNYQWRRIIAPIISDYLDSLAREIADETDRQEFEARIGNLLIDLYNVDIMDNTPVGAIVAYPKASPSPPKWLLMDGNSHNSSDYPDLASLKPEWVDLIEGTITLPNLSHQFIRGTVSNSEIGDAVGSDTHTLAQAELPAHTHDITHTHTFQTDSVTGTSINRVARGNAGTLNTQSTVSQSTSNSGSVGGGEAHNNIPAAIHMAYIIKALP